MKVVGAPIFGFVSFLVFSSLWNVGAHRWTSANPIAIRFDFPVWLIMLLAFIFFAFVNVIYKIYAIRDGSNANIKLFNNKAIVDTNDYQIILPFSKANDVLFSASNRTNPFFRNYFRIGKLKITVEGDTYTFLFPLRNQEVVDLFRNQFIKS